MPREEVAREEKRFRMSGDQNRLLHPVIQEDYAVFFNLRFVPYLGNTDFFGAAGFA